METQNNTHAVAVMANGDMWFDLLVPAGSTAKQVERTVAKRIKKSTYRVYQVNQGELSLGYMWFVEVV